MGSGGDQPLGALNGDVLAETLAEGAEEGLEGGVVSKYEPSEEAEDRVVHLAVLGDCEPAAGEFRMELVRPRPAEDDERPFESRDKHMGLVYFA